MSSTFDPLDPSVTFRNQQSLPDDLPESPMELALSWFNEARAKRVQPNPTAMCLATVDAGGQISSRMVLCREFNAEKGYCVFYTNYESRKANAIAENPRVALLFHWDALDRQIRIEGRCVRSPEAESDAYFNQREWSKRVGAWASDQSRPIGSRAELEMKVVEAMMKLGLSIDEISAKGNDIKIPRPPYWGGTRVFAERVELWLGQDSRIHDRAVWVRELREGDTPHEMQGGTWTSTRLQP
ncbi:MAG: pyridoxamine 5'-phosphate oxidase [Planctomycetota bacterium]|nr:pyridoxamine 5'-phosphate oxidase [Planctomycetota bacterium]